MGHREGKLATGDTAADHRDFGLYVPARHRGKEIAPAFGVDIKWLCTDSKAIKPRDTHFSGDPDIKGGNIICNRRAVFDMNQTRSAIDICGVGQDQTRARKAAQSHQVDFKCFT